MERQVFKLNPATGRVEHWYEQRGDAHIPRPRGMSVTPASVSLKTGVSYGRKVNGGHA